MFHPNNKPSFHHREPSFHNLLKSTESLFRREAQLDDTWSVLFMTGSGSLGIEAVLASLVRPTVVLNDEARAGKFSRRMQEVADHYNLNKMKLGRYHFGYVQYETSTSHRAMPAYSEEFLVDGKVDKDRCVVVDAVSAFPYYLPPTDCDIFITVSGKQLGSCPGIAIIAIRDRVWNDNYIRRDDTNPSYLNLARYLKARRDYETPNTPAITVLQDLHDVLLRFDRESLVCRINSRFKTLLGVVGFNEAHPNSDPSPVFTFDTCLPLKLSAHRNLYGREYHQVFLWNGSDAEFFSFINHLREYRHENPSASFWGS